MATRQKKWQAKQSWMTTEILEMMDKGRMLKNELARYEQMNNTVKSEYNKAKEKWQKQKCKGNRTPSSGEQMRRK